ncbi:MAG TPA: putative Ig domain-containing protein [Gaiellaceae bacterium]
MRRGLAVLLALVVASSAGAARAKPRVTIIGDSVGASLGWDAAATRIVGQRLDADLELQSCRRLTTKGCASAARESALETIRRLGRRLGPDVVIAVGYNDYPTVYAPGIEEVLGALRAAHVERVFWVTLHETSVQYRESDDAIRAAARRHPEMTVIDWNACAAGHGDWFGGDGVHLTNAGAEGLARCIADSVLRGLAEPPPLDVALAFRRGVTTGFHARLRATGGTPPYRFTVRGLPRGLHVNARGAVTGTVPRAGAYPLRVTVHDAAGRRWTLVVPMNVG